MTNCPVCGAYIPDGGKICLSCGYKPDNDTVGEMFSDKNPYINYLQQVMDTVVSEFPRDAMKHDNTGWIAAASYIGPAFLYTYYKNKDSELVRFHANQACAVFAAYLIAGIADRIPLVGGLIKKLLRTGIGVLAFMGARSAVAGKTEPLPVIGEIGIKPFG